MQVKIRVQKKQNQCSLRQASGPRLVKKKVKKKKSGSTRKYFDRFQHIPPIDIHAINSLMSLFGKSHAEFESHFTEKREWMPWGRGGVMAGRRGSRELMREHRTRGRGGVRGFAAIVDQQQVHNYWEGAVVRGPKEVPLLELKKTTPHTHTEKKRRVLMKMAVRVSGEFQIVRSHWGGCCLATRMMGTGRTAARW